MDRPINLVNAGIFNRVPTILGTNENEGTIFVPLAVLVVPVHLPINDTGFELILNHF